MHPGGARFLRLRALGTQQGNFRQCPYSYKTRRADGVGPTATGNPDRTLEGALFNLAVHLQELDIETGHERHC